MLCNNSCCLFCKQKGKQKCQYVYKAKSSLPFWGICFSVPFLEQSNGNRIHSPTYTDSVYIDYNGVRRVPIAVSVILAEKIALHVVLFFCQNGGTTERRL